MKNWYLNLQAQERLAVQIGGFLLLLLAFYLLLWAPIVGDADRLRRSVAIQQADLAWLKTQGQLAAQLRGSGKLDVIAARQGQGLPQLTSTTAGRFNLSIDRYQQGSSSDELSVWLDNANFNQLLSWLQELQLQYGLAADTVNITASDSLGIVKARIRFKDSKR